jgi:hypothetical protein
VRCCLRLLFFQKEVRHKRAHVYKLAEISTGAITVLWRCRALLSEAACHQTV